MNSPRKGQWSGAFVFSLICSWINGWVNKRDASDLRLNRAHYDVSVMINASFDLGELTIYVLQRYDFATALCDDFTEAEFPTRAPVWNRTLRWCWQNPTELLGSQCTDYLTRNVVSDSMYYIALGHRVGIWLSTWGSLLINSSNTYWEFLFYTFISEHKFINMSYIERELKPNWVDRNVITFWYRNFISNTAYIRFLRNRVRL